MSSPRFRQTEVRNGALARTDRENILLVEAKAHIGEVCSPPSQASVASRQQIEAALNETASFLNAEPRSFARKSHREPIKTGAGSRVRTS